VQNVHMEQLGIRTGSSCSLHARRTIWGQSGRTFERMLRISERIGSSMGHVERVGVRVRHVAGCGWWSGTACQSTLMNEESWWK
jgi:hypothetical protein